MSNFAFDAVFFDLDGTLVATERYWPDAARSATLAFFAARGIDRPVPSTADWMAMVGLPIEEAFAATFADLDRPTREALLAACMESEHALLDRGHAALLGGVERTLTALKERGVFLGIASNCGADYLDVMMNRVGLARWIDEGRCLASPGIGNKADMVEDLIQTFGTRSAVMVGDRRGDRDAGWANGLPHVHIPRGYGGAHDAVEAEAVLDGMDQLIPTLEARDAVLREVLACAGEARIVGLAGPPFANQALVARDLSRLDGEAGKSSGAIEGTVASLDAIGSSLARVFLSGDAITASEMITRCDAVVRVVANEDVLVRRAQGLRRGPGAVEALLGEGLPRYQSQYGELHAVAELDTSNALALRIARPA